MMAPQNAKLLKVYIGETYMAQGMPTYEHIVYQAYKHKIAGVTVMKGAQGMGHIGVIQHTEDGYNHDMPITLEIIDTCEKIEKFIPIIIEAMGNHGIIIEIDVSIIHQAKSHAFPRAKDPQGNDIKGF